jgi:putative drug exporter of the RND superfamily
MGLNDRLPSPWRQRLVAAAWFLIAVAALPFAARINEELDGSTRLMGSESARVEASLSRRFHSPFTTISLLRLAGVPAARTDAGRAVLKHVADALQATAGVEGTMSYLDRADSLFLGQDGSAIVIVGLKGPKGAADALMARLRILTDGLRAGFQDTYPAAALRWTGEAAVNADMRRLSGRETRTAELRVLPFTLLLLFIAFRSLIAAALPLVCGALTIVVSLGALAAVNRLWPASIIVVSLISMIGLGLSIDYALLIVSRFRDAQREGLSPRDAVREAARHGGRTVVVSGSAVIIGFAAMLFVPVSEVRSIGIGGLLVTTVAVLVASTLLPVLLGWCSPWMDVGGGRMLRGGGASARWWRRWAEWVTRHPLRVLVVAGLPLVLLAAQAGHLRVDLPRGSWLPDDADSVRTLHEIDAVARGNFGQIMHIVLYLPQGTTLRDEAGWRAESHLVRSLARDPRVQHVWAATTLSTAPLTGPEILEKVPAAARRSLVSEDGGAALIEVLPRQGTAAADAVQLLRDLRARDPEVLTGLPGARLDVGGVPGFNADYSDAIRGSLATIVGSVIGATLLVLSLAFRSVLIPLKAVALNLLSVAAAFGAVALVFQDGHGAWMVGLPHAMDGGFPIVPVLVFCIVFGLSMDYEVFIVARVADGRRAGLGDGDALVSGLVGTARVITFAAAIMVLIFGAFVFGDFVLIKLLGFALAVAVFLDATVIRLCLGPALIALAGRWNWWPGR